jgi:hypothetical protein
MQRTVYSPPSPPSPPPGGGALAGPAGRLLHGAHKGLKDCAAQLAQHRRDREADIQPPTIDLTATWTLLDTAVVTPLEEVQQRVGLSVDIVRDVYEAQVEMLAGSGTGGGGGGGEGGGGLIRQMDRVKARQRGIDDRMKTIAARLQEEVSICAGLMQYTSLRARGLTSGERAFSAELSRSANVVSRLDAAVQGLHRMQVRTLA